MRRQKKKWKEKLRVNAPSLQGAGLEDSESDLHDGTDVGSGDRTVGGGERSFRVGGGGRGPGNMNEDELHEFAPEGMVEKMKTRDMKQIAAMRRLASRKSAAGDERGPAMRGEAGQAGRAQTSVFNRRKQTDGREARKVLNDDAEWGEAGRGDDGKAGMWEWPEEEQALDMLDQQAIRGLEGQVAKYSARVIEVRGAGSNDVNGRYVRDGRGDFAHIGLAYRRSRDPESALYQYVLLYEEASNQFEDGRTVERDRWLLFNDALGVPGSNPFYEALGSWESGLRSRSRWRCVSGSAPPPSLQRVLALEDEDDDDDDEADGDVGADDSGDDEGLPLPPPLKRKGGRTDGTETWAVQEGRAKEEDQESRMSLGEEDINEHEDEDKEDDEDDDEDDEDEEDEDEDEDDGEDGEEQVREEALKAGVRINEQGRLEELGEDSRGREEEYSSGASSELSGRKAVGAGEDPWAALASFAKEHAEDSVEGMAAFDKEDEMLEEPRGGDIDGKAMKQLMEAVEEEIEKDVNDRRGYGLRKDVGLEQDVGFGEEESAIRRKATVSKKVKDRNADTNQKQKRRIRGKSGERAALSEPRQHGSRTPASSITPSGQPKPLWLREKDDDAHDSKSVGAAGLLGSDEEDGSLATDGRADGVGRLVQHESEADDRDSAEQPSSLEMRATVAAEEEEAEDEETTLSEEQDDDEEKDVKQRWKRFRQLNEEERALVEEGVRRGEGYKTIEDMIRARRGDFRGLTAQVLGGINVSAALDTERPIGLEAEPEFQLRNDTETVSTLHKKPAEGVEEVVNGPVELARVVRSSKGGNKVQGKRYASIASALWHAAQHGGGVITLEAGEYLESETLKPSGRTTIRASHGVPSSKIVVRGPKGRDVVRVESSRARVLLQNITLVRSRSRKEPLPAVHLHVTLWGACVRVSAGVVRCQGCSIQAEKGVGCIAMWDGVLQMAYSTVRQCGSDGVVAKDGGVVALNHTLVTGNRHNGVLALGIDSLARLRGCHLVSNDINGLACVHGSTVLVTRTSAERNGANGLYACGMPVVARGPSLTIGTSMNQGCVVNMTKCHVRFNKHNGVVVLREGDVTLTSSRVSFNRASGVGVAQARATVSFCDMIGNEEHGVVVDAGAYVNVSACNVSGNAQDGIGTFEAGSEVVVSRSVIANNEWGIAANCLATVTIQRGVKVRHNTAANKVEVKGGKIYREVLGPFRPPLDSTRLLRPEDAMQDIVNLESEEKCHMQGRVVPVINGHVSPKGEPVVMGVRDRYGSLSPIPPSLTRLAGLKDWRGIETEKKGGKERGTNGERKGESRERVMRDGVGWIEGGRDGTCLIDRKGQSRLAKQRWCWMAPHVMLTMIRKQESV